MKINDFIGQLFLARDVAHSVHLNTRSYAKHAALQEFYEAIVGLADTLAEAYQGRHGLIGTISLASVKKEVKIVEFLQAQLEELEGARYDVVNKSDTAIQQIIDNVVEQYLKTLYKLRFLV